MKHTMLIVWTMLLVAAVTGYGLYSVWRNMERWQDGPVQPKVNFRELAEKYNLGPKDFVLQDKNGNLFFSDQLKGKVWILNFFYTSCQQNCLKSNQTLETLLKKFPADDLIILSISCQPELDDPSVLKGYSKQFQGDERRWLFLTGDFNEIKTRIADTVHFKYLRDNHSEHVAVIGRDGKLRDVVEILDSDQLSKLEDDLRIWLDEPVPADQSSQATKQPEKNPE